MADGRWCVTMGGKMRVYETGLRLRNAYISIQDYYEGNWAGKGGIRSKPRHGAIKSSLSTAGGRVKLWCGEFTGYQAFPLAGLALGL